MATLAQLDEKARQDRSTTLSTGPPPLPPRQNSIQPPPPYSSDDDRRSRLVAKQWRSNDPRSSSTHSLVPEESTRFGRDGRRTLLLVYIHGFMGNETSFQSFPAHVHNLLTITLTETHVVHTKIYPRYKSRKAIDFARDDFSKWLEPHENDNTDVVLLGHSMGGILCAEVALIPGRPATGKTLCHRILGTISFDTPFLGMHPGVVVSGIGSLFRPAPDPPGSKQHQRLTSGETTPSASTTSIPTSYASSTLESRLGSETPSTPLSPVDSLTSTLASPPPNDPFYNPPFPNDIRLPERKGWTNILHFINKHSDTLTSATKQYVMSHLEFGGCLADYPGLKNRYEKIRSLEDVDGRSHTGPGYRAPTRRVRFINYYTASTGRPKEPAEPKIPPGQMRDSEGNLKPIEVEMQDMTLSSPGSISPVHTPRISVEEHNGGAVISKQLEEAPDASLIEDQMQNLGENSGVHNDIQAPSAMRHIDSMPIQDDESFQVPQVTDNQEADEPTTEQTNTPAEPPLPPIPAMPMEPEPIDLSIYTDKDDRKIAEKEQKRLLKVYQQAIKDRESAIRDRKKVVEKREKKARQEKEKQMKAEEKQRLKEEKEEEKRKATINPEPRERQASTSTGAEMSEKPKRDKKFCMLPPESGGKRDKCWVRVYMEGVDEVGAHCGLFFPGPQYESLVGDVGARIEAWVQEDAAR